MDSAPAVCRFQQRVAVGPPAHRSLCQTSTLTRGSRASTLASCTTPAAKSTEPTLQGKIEMEPCRTEHKFLERVRCLLGGSKST